ncbi:hypothetical protein Q4591_17780 [Shewanella sp. 3_MG-2023]|uniref:hypothetical protein n=1 Tax=Shewanella sp. 3_MG-2023 TaxID=3062635 RepID=UPI0026E28141|nr:hypothetical protein [Shewanella sp. 3_MG-2023]MDO6777198.1 hypothetical protein [Shewanella sp. 3_MG-2023]
MVDSVLKGISIDNRIVNALKSHRIINMTKPLSEFGMSRYKKRRNVKDEDMFSYSGKKVFVHLDNGDVIGFASNDVKRSVVTWFDEKDGVKEHFYLCRRGDEFSYDDPALSVKDNWSGIINEKVISITVFSVKNPVEDKKFVDSFEAAILLETAKGNMLISDASAAFKYSSSMPVVKLDDAPDGFFDNLEARVL